MEKIDIEKYNKAMAIRAFAEKFELPYSGSFFAQEKQMMRDAIIKAITKWEEEKTP